MAKDGLATTEVRLQAATYIKFEDISNAQLLDLRPSKLAALKPQADDSSRQPVRLPNQLDTSFNIHLSLENALEKLQSSSGSSSSSQQQTPALGKLSDNCIPPDRRSVEQTSNL